MASKQTYNSAHEAVRRLSKRLAAAEGALTQAVEVVHQWHGEVAWDLYWTHAPEMQAIREFYATKGGE